jgi:sugar-specific transcriptional regulator TrmB
MSLGKDSLLPKLLDLGLEADEARIYLHLLSDSPKSVLDVSRELGLGRNVVYRQIGRLEEKQLLSRVKSSSGAKVRAESYTNLEKLVEEQERRLANVKESSRALFGSLAQLSSQREAGGIRYFSGAEGLIQITEHSLQAKRELCIFEIEAMTSFVDFAHAERIRQGFVERRIAVKQLSNAKEIAAWTDVEELVRHYWECRYVSPDRLRVEFEFLIYNDTFAMYTFQRDDFWGLEVVSPAVAAMQRQLFLYVWNAAAKMRLLSNRGHVCLPGERGAK